MRDDHAEELGIRSYAVSGARLTAREMLKITDQLAHLRLNRVTDRLNRIVIHARTGMLIKAPWGPILGAHEGVSFQGVTLPWPTGAALDIVCAQYLPAHTVRDGCAEPRASPAYRCGIVHTVFQGTDPMLVA